MDGTGLLDDTPTLALESDVDVAPAPVASVERGRDRSVALLGEWIALIAAREEPALGKLHHATVAQVRRVVARIVPDAQLADEVVGDCFWQVWREASRFDATRGSVTTWVATIARSRALDAMRRRKTLAAREESLSETQLETCACAEPGPATCLEQRQRKRRLDATLALLDPSQRQVLSLAFAGGMSHEQVAEHSGLALGTVKSHIRRGLAQMHRHFVRAGLRP